MINNNFYCFSLGAQSVPRIIVYSIYTGRDNAALCRYGESEAIGKTSV